MSLTEIAIQRVADALDNDPEFRAAMRDDPNAAMAAKGLDEMHVDVRVVADTEDTFHVVLPPAPNADIPDDELDSVAGGFHWTGHDSQRAAYDAAWTRLIANLRSRDGWSAT